MNYVELCREMNKKGDLTITEALGIIIAVLGLIILFFGIWKLYKVTINQGEGNINSALNVIEARIENLKDGESGKFLISGQEGWFLTGWSKDEQGRPDKCYFNSCICACKGEPISFVREASVYYDIRSKKCQEKGFCRDVKKNIVKIRGQRINMITDKLGDFIILPKNAIEIEISKTDLELLIKKNE